MKTDISVSIPQEVIFAAIEKLMHFPFPQVCRHLVALELLSILEQHGATVSEELARAICQAKDEEALTLLQQRKVERNT